MIAQHLSEFILLLVVNLGLALILAFMLAEKTSRQLARIPVRVRTSRADRYNQS